MGELFFCGSINTRILQELVKWFPSTKKKYFPYHYLNFIFNIFWFISVYNALWLLSQAPDLSPPLTPFLHTNPFLRFIFSFCFVTHWVWPGLPGWTRVWNCPLAAVGLLTLVWSRRQWFLPQNLRERWGPVHPFPFVDLSNKLWEVTSDAVVNGNHGCVRFGR